MYKIILLNFLFLLINSEKFNIYKKGLFSKEDKEFIGTIKFEENYLISNSDIDMKGLNIFENNVDYVIIFESKSNEFRTIFTKNKTTRSICFEININFENKLMGFSLLNHTKIHREKRKKLQYFIKILNFSNISSNTNFERNNQSDINNIENLEDNEYLEENNDKIGGGEERINEKENPEDQSFFKKYFWYIVIGVIIFFQLKNFDTTKLKEKFEEAKAMQEAKMQNQNR